VFTGAFVIPAISSMECPSAIRKTIVSAGVGISRARPHGRDAIDDGGVRGDKRT
jgi:hypothetical protein